MRALSSRSMPISPGENRPLAPLGWRRRARIADNRVMHTSAPLPSLDAVQSPGGAIRALRLGSGLVLAVYVTAHLCNHALGVLSIDTQEALLDALRPIWQSAPGTIVLYT